MDTTHLQASLVTVNAGHCPHDDAPAETSAAMINFMQGLGSAARAAL